MSRLFEGGLPTAPDVKLIRDAFPEIAEGDEIAHESMEKILGIARTKSRYRTVTCAWRREMFNALNIEIAALPGVGFKCLPPTDRLNTYLKNFRSGAKKMSRSGRRLHTVRDDGLTSEDRSRKDHSIRLTAAITNQCISMFKEIQPPTVTKRLIEPRVNGAK